MAKWLYIGAIWKGEKGMSGTLEPEKMKDAPKDAKGNIRFSIFPNDKKDSDKHPDFKIAVKAEEAKEEKDPFEF